MSQEVGKWREFKTETMLLTVINYTIT